jgi:hypothetical protein
MNCVGHLLSVVHVNKTWYIFDDKREWKKHFDQFNVAKEKVSMLVLKTSALEVAASSAESLVCCDRKRLTRRSTDEDTFIWDCDLCLLFYAICGLI